MIIIVDYGMGNLGSIRNMFSRIGVSSVITGDPAVVARAEKLILPGVGAFDAAMKTLSETGLTEILAQKALVERTPTLGICLGMQLLTRGSEEGVRPGLGWIDAEAKRFPKGEEFKVPHIGWNTVECVGDCPWALPPREEQRFYFVHSYYVQVANEADSLFKTRYGLTFDSGIHHGNIYGFQFHPEKSHKFGMRLFSWFAEI
ncbi:imidazole glycerol phosphate synthase subunit HisH [Pseudodesulfovibrio sp. F-1]|uniref:Imidazole glycerol phosphate synthase subunit HisH n=1 Tax=Pseudodesulfovibrio alkaliphilus TaxID=2661613 RepID=A0A7K1KNR7_9BACT|nr:imidazole glycerol phosphate synthase subunit HisH [Pseudodesulfovibrio alkaliphilus]MUM77531.1 imidazole glycerol phosphate synthase subunit HisH [Pseudodesulfovibrio alkaliphilus]